SWLPPRRRNPTPKRNAFPPRGLTGRRYSARATHQVALAGTHRRRTLMTTKRVMPLVAAALALGLALLLVAESSARPAQQPGASDGPELAALQNSRDATAVYLDPAAASAAGYELFTDNAGLACIEQPGDGAMGVHF